MPPENISKQEVSDVSRGYRKRSVVYNGLINKVFISIFRLRLYKAKVKLAYNDQPKFLRKRQNVYEEQHNNLNIQ